MSPSPEPRPALTIVNEGLPRLAAMTGLVRVLSVAETRELLDDEELDELLALVAEHLKTLGTLLARWQRHGEVG